MKYYNTGFSFSQHFGTQMYLNDTTNFADGTSLCNDSKLQLIALQKQPIKISQGGEHDSSTSMPSVPSLLPSPPNASVSLRNAAAILIDVYVCSVGSDSLRPHGLQPSRILCPCNFPPKNTGMGCHFLPQRIFLT